MSEELDDWITPAEAGADDWITPSPAGRIASQIPGLPEPTVSQENRRPLVIPGPPPEPMAVEPEGKPLPDLGVPEVDLGLSPTLQDPSPLARIDTMRFDDGSAARMPVPADLTPQAPQPDAKVKPLTAPMPERDYTRMGVGEVTWDQLRSGVETMRQGAHALPLSTITQELQRLDAVDANPDPRTLDPGARRMAADYETPEARQAYRRQLQAQLLPHIRAVVESQQFQQTLARNPNAQRLVEALNAGNLGEGVRIFLSDPGGITKQFSVESAPMSAPMLVAGPLAGLAGGAAAGVVTSFLTSYGTEFGPRVIEGVFERLRDAGVNIQDPAAVQAALQANPGIVGEANSEASRGALGPAAFDALTMGTGAGIQRGLGFWRNAGRVARNAAGELISEPLGEAAGQVAEKGYVHSPGELAAELLGAGPQVVGTTAYGTVMDARRSALEGVTTQPDIVPPATPPFAPVFGPPEPPPGAAPAAPPAAATPVAPPPAPAAPPAPPQAPPVDMPQQPAQPPAAAPEAAPAPVPAPAPVLPPAPPPPPVHTGRAELEGLLNDPRPMAQIEADRERQRQQGIQQAQSGLPQGWRVVDEDGTVFLLDPRGDWQGQVDGAPSAQTAQEWATIARDLEAQGLYADVRRVGDGTRAAPVQVNHPSDIHAAGGQVNQNPTEAQAAAGNYQKGHLRLHGLDISIENPQGSTRSGTAPDGSQWSVQMPHPYGYVKGTRGSDGDQVDVYLGPQAHQPGARVYVIDQIEPGTRTFDEHKALLGFPDEYSARDTYLRGFSDGSGGERLGAITSMSMDQFRQWLNSGKTKQALAYQPPKPASPKKQRQAKTLMQFLAARGGVKDDGGDIRHAFGGRNPFVPGFGTLIRANGVPLDWALQAAIEEHFLHPTADINDLLEAIDEEQRGRPAMRPDDQRRAEEAAAAMAAEGDTARRQAMAEAIEAFAAANGVNATAEEKEAAVERAEALGIAPEDALIEVLEQELITAVEEVTAVANEGTEWEVPWNAQPQATPDAGGPPAAGGGRAEARPAAAEAERPGEAEPPPAGDRGGESGGGATETVQTLDGEREQHLIPGVKPVTDKDRLAVMEAKPLQGGKAPPPAGGLFDPGATQQPDLVDQIRQQKAAEPKPEEPPAPKGPDYGTPDSINLKPMAEAFAEALMGGKQFVSIAAARQFAARLLGGAIEPGTRAAKDLEEAIELGVVLAARQIVANGGGPKAVYARLRQLYQLQPRLGTRTSDSIERQAYSTPAPLAWLASTLAGIDEKAEVIEPTAGNGMLLIGATPSKTSANELDGDRAAALRIQGFGPTTKDATAIDWKGYDADAVITNPPFGAVKGPDGRPRRFDMGFIQPGYETGEIDHAIALQALEGMKDGGRAVLILGGIAKTVVDPAKRGDAYHSSKAKREFFLTLYRRYNVVKQFTVAGELYARQGAAWPVDVIVIHGRGKSALPLPAQQAPKVYSSWEALEGLFDERLADGTTEGSAPDGVGTTGDQRGAGSGGGKPGGRGEGAAPVSVPAPAGAAGNLDVPAGAEPGAGGGQPGAGTGSGGGVAGKPPRGRRDNGRPGDAGGQPAVAGLPGEPSAAAGSAPVPGEAVPGGAAGGAADQPRGVDGAGNPSGDVSAAFDAEMAALFGEEPAAAPPAAPAPAGKPRTAGEAAASAASNAAKGADDAMAALTKLFGGGKLNSGMGWSEETWQAAKPLFQAALGKFQAAGRDVREAMGLLLRQLKEAYAWTRDMLMAARPYIERFITEATTTEAPAEATTEAAPAAAEEAPAPPRKPKQQDEETDRQVAYKPRADADGVGTLVPVNMQTSVAAALEAVERRAGMPLVEFVGEKLGYSPAEVRQYFSAEQIDAIALGMQNLDDGAGFVIGDQTGVGKGRFVAAMIRYSLRRGLIPVFVTEKPNLYRDMARDLTDIGMPGVLDQIFPTNAGLKLPLTDDENGPELRTPQAKAHNLAVQQTSAEDLIDKQRIVFTTYSQLQQIGEKDTPRIQFMRAIAPQSFLILDEAHNAGVTNSEEGDKSGKADRGALFRQFLQRAKSAVYSSATWAKRPDVMDLYGIKTDMRLAVANLSELADAISAGGVPMQQIVSAMLAESGQYIRRERSFAGVTYDLEPIEVDRATYDGVSLALSQINQLNRIIRGIAKEKDDDMKGDAERIGVKAAGGIEAMNFGSVMHNLINQMLLASKAPGTARLAIEQLKAGKKPVIALANTMGSFIEEYTEENDASPGDRLDLDFNALLMRYLQKAMTLTKRKPFMQKGEKAEQIVLTRDDLPPEGRRIYDATVAHIGAMDLTAFPVSPIDYIRSQLVQAGYRVGEITGRTEAADYRADGGVYYRRRPQHETTAAGKLEAINAFNGGSSKKPLAEAKRIDVMILNQSGATGLSLHANSTFGDQRQRVMLIAQAEANVDTHMQMLGRVHRTGQVIPPGYLQLVATVPAENRPAAVLAKKMASLAASTTANRKGTLGAENAPDFINEYGDRVVFELVSGDRALLRRLGEPSIFGEGGRMGEDVARKVTGRIPLLPLKEQEELYAEIEKRYRRALEIADEDGTNSLEAKTLELDAKLIEERPWTEGKGDRLFGGSSSLGLFDVKRLRKPPAPYITVGRIAASIGRKLTNDEIKDKPRAQLAEVLVDVSTDAVDWAEDQIVGIDGAARRLRKEAESGDLSDKQRAQALRRIDDQAARLKAVLKVATPGAFVDVTFPEETGSIRGLVVDISPPEKGNPIAPGSWEMTVLFEDGTRDVRSLADVFTPENRPQSGKEGTKEAAPTIITGTDGMPTRAEYADFFEGLEQAARGSREERWIVTGNLLAGFAKRHGQILNFYDHEGNLRQGVMMDAKFDPDAFEKGLAPTFDSEEAWAFMADAAVQIPMIQTRDEALQIARDTAGNYVISGPASKSGGADLFLDRQLRDAIGKEFVAKGDRMRATFGKDRLSRVIDRFMSIATARRQDVISPSEGAKEWLEKRRGAIEDRGKAVSGAAKLYANPFDPEAFNRYLLQPLKGTAKSLRDFLLETAANIRAENWRFLQRVYKEPAPPKGVTVERPVVERDLSPLARWLKTPERLFNRWPQLAALVQAGIRAEERMSNYGRRLNEAVDRAYQALAKAKGKREVAEETLLLADLQGIDLANEKARDAFFDQQGLGQAERSFAVAIHQLLERMGRLVDNHRRMMMPKVRARKAEVWARMDDILATAGVKSDEYARLYRRRSTLNGRIKRGKGDLAKQAAEVEQINEKLRNIRMRDPEIQARLGDLQAEYDMLEARLAATTVRRRKGYFPHKFFGSWRLFVQEGLDEEGNPIEREITSDQGFYDTMGEALAAARIYLRQNPGAKLAVRPKAIFFPNTDGTELTDRAYFRLRRALEEQAQLTGADLNDMLKGVARTRNRRRVYAPGLFRKGAKGFSEDVERVLRTHIGQSFRYTEMDRLKFRYVSVSEGMGLSPLREASNRREGRGELQKALDAWWRDVNGAPQPFEQMMDRLLERSGVRMSTLAAVAIGGGVGSLVNPAVGVAMAGYWGYRMWRANKEGGGSFTTRALVNKNLSDTAHLKLGMALNLSSASINLTQTAINTYPVLGERWTGVGIRKASAALLSQAMHHADPSKMSDDAHLLIRADIATRYKFTEEQIAFLQGTGLMERARRISMLPFETAERYNRAVAYLGAYYRAEARGASPAQALREAQAVTRRTQFHQGNANKPEILRQLLLKMPLQFKNFMFQEIAFVTGLRGAEIPRFIGVMFLLAGLLGSVPGADWWDWLCRHWFGLSPINSALMAALDFGNAGTFLARGLPGLLGVDIVERLGIGKGFLPNEPSDFYGPFAGTVARAGKAWENGSMVEMLAALTPAANPLRALEAANLGIFRNPNRRGMPEFGGLGSDVVGAPLSTSELVLKGLGFRNIREAQVADVRSAQNERTSRNRTQADRYLSRIVEAVQKGENDRVGVIVQEARQAGVELTQKTIRDTVRDAQLPRELRDVMRAPRRDRPELLRRYQQTEGRATP